MQSAHVTPLSTFGQVSKELQQVSAAGGVVEDVLIVVVVVVVGGAVVAGGAGQEAGASGLTHLHNMSDVPGIA